jgi:hypothetical protein
MAILVSKAAANHTTDATTYVYNLGSKDTENVIFGVDTSSETFQLSGSNKVTILDVSNGDKVVHSGLSSSGMQAKVTGNTVTLSDGTNDKLILGALAGGESVTVEFSDGKIITIAASSAATPIYTVVQGGKSTTLIGTASAVTDSTAPAAPSTPVEKTGNTVLTNGVNTTEAAGNILLTTAVGSSNAIAGDTITLYTTVSGVTSAIGTPHVLVTADLTTPYDFTIAGSLLTANATNLITTNITDVAGNIGTASSPLTVVVDTAAPTVGTIAIASATGILNSTLNAGDVVSVNVPFSEVVNVTGTPQLALTIDSTVVQASYVSGTGTNSLVFGYTILANQTDTNGISIAGTSALTLNSGTINDVAGNAATLTTVAVADNSGYLVDASAPTAPTSITVTTSGGTVTSNTLNSTNTYLTASAGITAGLATGGSAALKVGSTIVATDNTINSGDTTVDFTTSDGSPTNAELQTAIAAGGAVTVELFDSAGNKAIGTGSTLTVDYVADAGNDLAIAATTLAGSSDIVFKDFVRLKVTGSDFLPSDTINANGGTVAVVVKDLAGNTVANAGYFGDDQFWYTSANSLPSNTSGTLNAIVETTDAVGNVKTVTTPFKYDRVADDGNNFAITTDAVNQVQGALYVYDQNVGLKVTGADTDPNFGAQTVAVVIKDSNGATVSSASYYGVTDTWYADIHPETGADTPRGKLTAFAEQIDKAGNVKTVQVDFYDNIQKAVIDAPSGAVIKIASGSYSSGAGVALNGALNVPIYLDKNIKLQGFGGTVTVYNGTGSNVFEVPAPTSGSPKTISDISLDSLTIKGGYKGFYVAGSATTDASRLSIGNLSITNTDFIGQFGDSSSTAITLALNPHKTSNVDNLTIQNVSVKGLPSSTKAISLFGFDGKALIENVTIDARSRDNAGVLAGSDTNTINKGIEIQGSGSSDINNTNDDSLKATLNAGFTTANSVIVKDVTMVGKFTTPIGIGMYGSIDGITLGTTDHEINLSGVILNANTPYVTAEYIADSTIDVSSWKVNSGISSPASFVIWGESGNQTVGSSGVHSSIKGSNGADALFGGSRTTVSLTYSTGDRRDSGGSGNDTFNGGLGDDYLSGGAGNDTFFFDNSGTAATWNVGKDNVLDYGVGGKNTTALANATITGLNGDVLQFSNADLAALTGFVNTNDAAYVTPTSTSGSTIQSAGLVAGAGTQTATGTTAQFLYNSSTGSLKFDVDGGGSGAAIDVATILPIGLSLTATDFLIVA